jgi:FkbM family methyltransferase
MLKPLPQLISEYNLNMRGVIHVGGHRGQEYQYYKEANIPNIIFVEPLSNNMDVLKKVVGEECVLFQTALGNQVGTVEMYIEEANQGQSSSILEPQLHLQQYPNIEFLYMHDVPITKLDLLEFDRNKFNMINIDVQGFELEVFRGGTQTLETIDYIYSEVNREELYAGCARVEQLDLYLGEFKFERIGTWWEGVTWGDALYVKQ